ncbi:MAG: YfhO family protein [bacterium]
MTRSPGDRWRRFAGADGPVGAAIVVATLALHPQLVRGTPWTFGHDCLEYAVPHALHFFRELAAGRLALWNPFHDGGAPFLAQPPWMGPFYPAVALFALPMGRALDVGFLLHLASFALGAFVLGRTRGLGRVPATFAAIALGAGTPLSDLARLGYLPEAVALSYLPWILACLDRGTREVSSRREAILGAGLCLGLMHLGGHLVASGVVLFGATFYALALGYSLGARRGLARALGLLAASEALGFAIAAITLVPLLASGLESSLSEGRDISGEYVYLQTIWRLGSVLFADFDPSGKGHVFIGVVLLPFVALAGWRSAHTGRGNAELWTLLIGAVVLSLGDATPVWRGLRALAAPFRIFSYFYFFCVPATLALALLAAHGLDAALRARTRQRGDRLPIGAVVVLAFTGCLVLAAAAHGEARELVRPRVLASLPWTIVGLAGAAVAVRWPVVRPATVGIVLAIELVHFSWLQRLPDEPAFSVARYFDRAELAENLPPQGAGRVVVVERTRPARDWSLRRNGGMVLGYEDVARDSKLPLARVARLTDRLGSLDVDWVRRLAASKHAATGERARLVLRPDDVDVRILDVLGVTALVTDLPVEGDAFRIPFRALAARRSGDAVSRIWERAERVPRHFLATRWRTAESEVESITATLDPSADPFALPIVEGAAPREPGPGSDAAPSAVREAATHVTRAWAPGRVVFDTASASPAVLVTGEIAARGWRASVDGAVVRPAIANGVLLAVPLSAGLHHVEVRYLPGAFAAGATISLLALVALSGLTRAVRRAEEHRER